MDDQFLVQTELYLMDRCESFRETQRQSLGFLVHIIRCEGWSIIGVLLPGCSRVGMMRISYYNEATTIESQLSNAMPSHTAAQIRIGFYLGVRKARDSCCVH
jgi:hypothetical protein